MNRLLIALLAAAVATPVVAQHTGHDMQMDMPRPEVQPPASKKPTAKPEPAGKTTPATTKSKPSAKAVQEKPNGKPSEPANPHAGHNMGNREGMQPSAPGMSHDMGSMSPPSTKHDMGGMGNTVASPPKAPPPAGAFSGPRHAAETIFAPRDMAGAREELRVEQGGMRHSFFLADRLEARSKDGYLWDMQAWYGGDINKLWLKTEGEGGFGHSPEDAEFQALYSRAISPWFNFQTGLRYDVRPTPERTHFVLGIQGLLPYVFELDAAAFLSNKGDLTGRFEFEYDQLITQRLILQPRIEVNLAARDIPELRIGSGLSSMEAGVRLRYEFRREFAPYLGVSWGRKLGATADFARAAGESPGGWNFVLGIRTWF